MRTLFVVLMVSVFGVDPAEGRKRPGQSARQRSESTVQGAGRAMAQTIELPAADTDGKMNLETALANADSATDLEAKINFG